ncbi:hypothetical protein BD309DRAFT_970393 [Dichomitus squalens]|nr:hypothetical protein BD309DRAFT_970393 [Dichomitus squalens]
MPRLGLWLAYSFLSLPLWTRGVYGDNTTCASAQLDWYTDAVGETPCVTYQRLRQICNNDYQVQKFRPNTPGDNCNDQLSGCCCNSVAWALSMLCMNCQYDTEEGGDGIDAGVGGYGLYLGSCSPVQNKTLPNDIQSAVCNKEIKLDRSLYGLFWDTGAWFYVYTKETIVADLAASNNNTFTNCASTTKNDTTTTSGTQTTSGALTGSAAPTSTGSSSSSSHIGAIVGGVVGGIVGAIALGLVAFFLVRRRARSQGPRPLDLAGEYRYEDGGDPPMSTVTPFSATASQGPTSRYGRTSDLAEESESIALLPRSGPQSSASGSGAGSGLMLAGGSAATTSSKFAGVDGYPQSPPALDEEGERHADAGPVPQLQRSASGRLPPAYRSWEDEPNELEPEPQWDGPSVTGVPYAAAASSSDAAPLPQTPLSPQYPADVKRPAGHHDGYI